MSKRSRKRQTRRDRRKAKQSKWTRMPKKNGVVGHGSALTVGHVK